MGKYVKKYILNKLIIILFVLLFLFNFNLQSIEKNNYDTVNVRKAFFLYEKNWDKYIKNKRTILDSENKIAFGCTLKNGIYDIFFFVSPEDNTYGRFQYKFDIDKELLEAAIFFQNDKTSFLLFKKNNPGKFDIILFGKIYKRNLPYYFPFDSLKTISLYNILSLLEDNKLQNEALITKDDSTIKEKLISKIILPSVGFKYVDDGARDEFGNFIYIENENDQKTNEQGFNCSGFIKDIADNYIRLINPDFRYLNIPDLKKERTNERENIAFQYYDLDYDPFFGLDWAKNISDKINQLCNYNVIRAEEYNKDNYVIHQKYRGYDIDNLKEILFRDQQNDSTNFYILVFNRLRIEKPVVPEYYHLAIVVPYFNDKHFYLRVFESSYETDFTRISNLTKDKSREEKIVIIKVPVPVIYL